MLDVGALGMAARLEQCLLARVINDFLTTQQARSLARRVSVADYQGIARAVVRAQAFGALFDEVAIKSCDTRGRVATLSCNWAAAG